MTAWAVGRRLTLRLGYRDGLEAALLSTAMGIGALGTALVLLAVAGLFAPVWITLVLVTSLALSRRALESELRGLLRWLRAEHPTGAAALAIVAIVGLSPLLILPLYPPVTYDAVLFHLPFAQAIGETQGLGFFAHLRYPIFPASMQALYAAAMMLGSDLLPGLVHFLCFLLVGALLFHWARTSVSPRAGYWAALLWLATPGAVYAGTTAYVECAVALFATAAILCLRRHRDSDEGGWLLAGACFAAFAAASSYSGLALVALFALYLATATIRKPRPRIALAASALVLLVALPSYGPIVARTGNPVFPFLPTVFGSSAWAHELMATPERLPPGAVAAPEPLTALVDPNPESHDVWRSESGRPRLYGWLDLFRYDDRIATRPLSPLLLALLALVPALAVRSVRARPATLGLVAYLAIWAALSRDPLHLLPAVPVWILLGSEALDRLLGFATRGRRTRVGRAAAFAVSLVLVVLVSIGAAERAWHYRHLPLTGSARQAHVTERLPAAEVLFAFGRMRAGRERLYGLFVEDLRYYARGAQVGDWFGPDRFATALALARQPAALHAWLGERGIDYLLYPDPRLWRPDPLSQLRLPPAASLASHFETAFEGEQAVLLRRREPSPDEPPPGPGQSAPSAASSAAAPRAPGDPQGSRRPPS